ncbi:glycosyltransferase [Candidatus Woesebacteria bacterium]|nr:glycosyltransferase [Candidatus Woesebacteria bacterium]MCD8506865.1 glycosyltransferase [Candidatus Woesebacteria bacterium]MCD8527516.1 glycosyltransferase [Candidatus Woesebacteria bacterium]MCD8546256.1 glycosyltransferase [Candidatus Woesebacteria bacterium]
MAAEDMYPSISIVMPNYNQGHFLEQAIVSLLRQNYPFLEILVMDGGSTDASVDILQQYDEAIHWVSEPDNGQTDALNKGFRQASGDIIGFLNADDILLPGTLWGVAELFRQYPETIWVTGEYDVIDSHGQSRDQLVRLYKRAQRDVVQWFPRLFSFVLGVNNPYIQPSTFWRREVHTEVGYLREDLDLVMDYEWWWRLYQAYGAPKIVPFVWSLFRVHEDSKGGQFFGQRLAEQWRVAQEYQVPRWQLMLHRFHNQVVTWMYSRGIS